MFSRNKLFIFFFDGFVGHPQTLSLMQTEYLYPRVADRTSPKEWVENGSPGILDHAIRKTREILSTHYPAHIPEALDRPTVLTIIGLAKRLAKTLI